MSNSPNTETDDSEQLPSAFRDLGKLLTAGKSFSGRERNCCFLNTSAQSSASGRFANVSSISGLDFADDGRSVATTDWDNDGDLDLWMTNRNAPRIRFMRNESKTESHFISLRLIGNGRDTNRNGIGARVEVRAVANGNEIEMPLRHIKTLRAGEGFQSQSSQLMHFGLGKETEMVTVIVQWPNSEHSVQHFGPLLADQSYELKQDEKKAIAQTQGVVPTKLGPKDQDLPDPTNSFRLPCIVRLPIVELPYTDLSSGKPNVLELGEKPTILSFWSATCLPCLQELGEFVKRADAFRAEGIDVVALCVDGLSDEDWDPTMASRFLKSIRFPFRSGSATQSLVSYFQRIYGYQTPVASDFPLPTSFLIDSKRRLAYVYKGPVPVPQIITDAKDMVSSSTQRFAIAAALPGRTIDHPIVARKLREQEFKIRYRLGEDLRRANRLTAAIGEFQTAIQLDPNSAAAHNNLGLCFRAAGKLNDAKSSYQSALRLDKTSSEAYNNLGVVYLKQGNLEAAIMQFRLALRYRPKYVDALINLGLACQKTREFEKAIACYEFVLSIRPNHAAAIMQSAIVAEKQDRLQDAVQCYEQLLATDNNHADAHHNLGVVYARLGNVEKGIHHLNRTIKLSPVRADAHNNLGLLYENQNQVEAARKCFEKALKIDPTYLPARRNLSNINALDGESPK